MVQLFASNRLINQVKKTRVVPQKVGQFISKHPFPSFFGVLGLLLVLVVVGNFVRKPPATSAPTTSEPKLVSVYQPGQSPTMTLSGKVEESGIITIVAQTAGVVQKVNITEGKHINRSTNLVNLSATYSGANPSAVSRQIAQTNAQFNNDNFGAQVDIINRQRDLANKSEVQAAELRDITRQSLADTRRLVDLNTSIVNSLNDRLNTLQAQNAPASDILVAQQAVAGATAGLNQLTASLRTAEYQASDTTIPAQSADATRDLTLRQLDLQEKSLTLTKDIANLNVKLAKINESLFYPTSPCTGLVERVFVKVGQSVSPGTPIAAIRADARQLDIVVPISVDLSPQVNTTEPSIILIKDKKITLTPRFVSSQPTEGALAAIFYTVPADQARLLEGQSNVSIQVPIGISKTSLQDIFVPLDAVYQTQEKSYVYVIAPQAGGQVAQTKEVTLGTVSGSYVQVMNGLSHDDQVISDRGITDGERVRTE